MHVGLIDAGNIARALAHASAGGTTARWPAAPERARVRPDLQATVDAAIGAGQ